MDKVAAINQYHMDQFAYFLNRLKKTQEGEGSLLDSTTIVYGGGISDGNRHNHDNLPVLLAGGSRNFKTGRHVRYSQNEPVANLYLSIMDAAGVPTEHFGDSQSRLQFLGDLT
jgi:hypothetical protein